MIRFKSNTLICLLSTVFIHSIWLLSKQQVSVSAELNTTQTVGILDTILSDIFKNDTQLSQSISKYLGDLPTDEKFASKAKETLKDAAVAAPEDDKLLIKSLVEVVLAKGKETLAKSECRPCPSCGETASNATTAKPSVVQQPSTPVASAAPSQPAPGTTTTPTKPPLASPMPAISTTSTRKPFLLSLAPFTLPPLRLPPLPVLGASRLSLEAVDGNETSSTQRPTPLEVEDDEGDDDHSVDEGYSYDYALFSTETDKGSFMPKDRRKRALNESIPIPNELLFDESVKFLVNNAELSTKLIESFSLLPQDVPDPEHELAKGILSHFKVTRKGKQANETTLVVGYVLDHFRLITSGCKVCPACPVDVGLRAMRTRGRGTAIRGRPVRGGRTGGRWPAARWPTSGSHRARAPARAPPAGGGGGPAPTPGGGNCGSAPLNPLTASSQSGYIVGGETARYGEWPSYVFVRSVTSPGWSSTCGGVLVSPNAVMTAAHCVVDSQTEVPRAASAFTITVGEYSVSGRDKAEKSYQVSRVCKASRYSGRGAAVFDYAVLTVAGTVAMSNYVQTACLPESPVATSGAGAKCYIPGLGAVGFTDAQSEHTINARVLQKMRVHQTSCSVWGHQSDPSRICFTNADGRRADSCRGDSGGPILCLNGSNKWTVVGLVSYGTKNCAGGGHNNFVGVYADVTKLLPTIRSQCGI